MAETRLQLPKCDIQMLLQAVIMMSDGKAWMVLIETCPAQWVTSKRVFPALYSKEMCVYGYCNDVIVEDMHLLTISCLD